MPKGLFYFNHLHTKLTRTIFKMTLGNFSCLIFLHENFFFDGYRELIKYSMFTMQDEGNQQRTKGVTGIITVIKITIIWEGGNRVIVIWKGRNR